MGSFDENSFDINSFDINSFDIDAPTDGKLLTDAAFFMKSGVQITQGIMLKCNGTLELIF